MQPMHKWHITSEKFMAVRNTSGSEDKEAPRRRARRTERDTHPSSSAKVKSLKSKGREQPIFSDGNTGHLGTRGLQNLYH